MECDICYRDDVADVGMNCASCARTILYGLRLQAARVFLEKQTLNAHFEEVTSNTESQQDTSSASNHSRTFVSELHNVERYNRTETQRARDEVNVGIRADIETLREDVRRMKEQVQYRKADLMATQSTVMNRGRSQHERTQEIISRGEKSTVTLDNRLCDTRAFLCQEVAALLRFRQRRSRKNDVVREHYLLAGFIIPDLRNINNLKCTVLTTVLGSVAQLVVLVAFYLGIRLPCEITLPYRDYPLPTINTPSNSYLGAKTPFPGSGSNLSVPSSPASSKYDTKTYSRPRPLFIGSDDRDELVSHVATRDPTAFNLFVEATSLLAWDVSWLLHSQGFAFGYGSWEDACHLGRNLWHLVFAPAEAPQIRRAPSGKDTKDSKKPSRKLTSTPTQDVFGGKLGRFSHASAHAFLGSTTAKDQTRPMKLSKYTMIFDPLRKALVTEMKNAEWEVLEDDELDDGGERFDEAVVVKNRMMDVNHYDDTRSLMTTKTVETNEPDDSNRNETKARSTGTSGWTKVKTREPG